MIEYHRKSHGTVSFQTNRYGGVSRDGYASLNLGYFSGDEKELVAENRRLLSMELQLPAGRLFVPNEVHGCEVMVVDESALQFTEDEKNQHFICDALITTYPNVCVGVTTADCVPVLLWSREVKVVAAVHAGWKGVVSHVITNTISRLVRDYSVSLATLHAEVLACISQEAFEVGDEVADQFRKAFGQEFASRFIDAENYSKPHVDLRKAVETELLENGLLKENIYITGDCTFREDKFFSARRDGFASGRMVAGIFLT